MPLNYDQWFPYRPPQEVARLQTLIEADPSILEDELARILFEIGRKAKRPDAVDWPMGKEEETIVAKLAEQMAGPRTDYGDELGGVDVPEPPLGVSRWTPDPGSRPEEWVGPPTRPERNFSESPLMGGFGLGPDQQVARDFRGRVTSEDMRRGGGAPMPPATVDEDLLRGLLAPRPTYPAREIDFPGDMGLVSPQERMSLDMGANRWTPEGRAANVAAMSQYLPGMREQEVLGMVGRGQIEATLQELAQQAQLARERMSLERELAAQQARLTGRELDIREGYNQAIAGQAREKESEEAQREARRAVMDSRKMIYDLIDSTGTGVDLQKLNLPPTSDPTVIEKRAQMSSQLLSLIREMTIAEASMDDQTADQKHAEIIQLIGIIGGNA